METPLISRPSVKGSWKWIIPETNSKCLWKWGPPGSLEISYWKAPLLGPKVSGSIIMGGARNGIGWRNSAMLDPLFEWWVLRDRKSTVVLGDLQLVTGGNKKVKLNHSLQLYSNIFHCYATRPEHTTARYSKNMEMNRLMTVDSALIMARGCFIDYGIFTSCCLLVS